MAQIGSTRFTLKNGKTSTIRTANENDAENLLVYFNQIMKDDRFFMLTFDDPEAKELTIEKERDWLKKLQNPGSIGIVAEIDSDIIGFVHINGYSLIRRRHVGILSISILPPYRDQGLGAHLIKTILDWAKQEPQLEKVALAVFSSNCRAIHLYKKLGFVEEGRQINEIKFATGQYADSVLMYKFVK